MLPGAEKAAEHEESCRHDHVGLKWTTRLIVTWMNREAAYVERYIVCSPVPFDNRHIMI